MNFEQLTTDVKAVRGKSIPAALRKELRAAAAVDGSRCLAAYFDIDEPTHWHNLTEASGKSPWRSRSKRDVATVITDVFQGVEKKQRSLIKELIKRCHSVIAVEDSHGWHLLYIVERSPGGAKYWQLDVLVGGAPSVELPKPLTDLGWTFPGKLAEFYKVHNGFGPLLAWPPNRGVCQVLCSEAFETLDVDRHRLSQAGTPMAPEPNALLGMYIDEVGNRKGMYWEFGTNNFGKASDRKIKSHLCDWDHETHDVSKEGAPTSFIAKAMVEWLRAKDRVGSFQRALPHLPVSR